MGTKTLTRLLIAVAVVALAAVILKFAGGGGVQSVESKSTFDREKVLPDFPINEVSQLQIKSRDESLTLKKKDKTWVVAEREDFPANFENIFALLTGVNRLRAGEPMVIGKSHLGRLDLNDPNAEDAGENTATILSFKDAEGKDLTSLWLGKAHEVKDDAPNPYTGGASTTATGRYVTPGDKDDVFLVGETFDLVKTDPTEWTTDDFFKVEQIKSIAIDTGNPEEDWKMERPDLPEEMVLVDAKEGEELDTAKISPLKSAFGYMNFRDIYVGDEKPKTDAVKFTIETFTGFNYVINLGEEDDSEGAAVRPLSFSVEADIQEKRVPGEEEDEAATKHLDEQFEKRKKEFKEKLALEKKLADGRVYKVAASSLSSFIKKREEILRPEPEPEKPPGVDLDAPLPGVGALPGPAAKSAPKAAPKSKGEAPKAKGKANAKSDAPKAKGNGKAETPKGKAEAPKGKADKDAKGGE